MPNVTPSTLSHVAVVDQDKTGDTAASPIDVDTRDDSDTTSSADSTDESDTTDSADTTDDSDATPSTVDPDTTSDIHTTASAVNQNTADDTTPSALDGDTTGDTVVPSQTCRKCHKLKVPAEFISERTGRPTVTCRMCLAPNPQTVRDSPDKRKVPASRKAADNTKIHEELEGICVSNKVKSRERKAGRRDSASAREAIRKAFGGVSK